MHALQKVTSQHRHFQTLINFSHSPLLQNVLRSELEIVTVPPRKHHLINIPAQVSVWKKIVDTIAGAYYKHGATWPEGEAQDLFERFSKPISLEQSDPGLKVPPREPLKIYGVIHSECALIAHLATLMENQKPRGTDNSSARDEEQENTDSGPSGVGGPQKPKPQRRRKRSHRKQGPGRAEVSKAEPGGTQVSIPESTMGESSPFSYIGVSKLSCAPCQLCMDGFNGLGGPCFYTRGSYGKWYSSWGLPEFESDRLGEHIISEISDRYLQHCRSLRRLRNLSDGSNAGMHDAPKLPTYDPKVEDLGAALLQANPWI